MSIICRAKVGSAIPAGESTTVNLYGLHSPDELEDDPVLEEIRSFFKATPSLNLNMVIASEAAAEQFQQGDEFYIKLERIPTDQTSTAVYARKAEETRKTPTGAGDGTT